MSTADHLGECNSLKKEEDESDGGEPLLSRKQSSTAPAMGRKQLVNSRTLLPHHHPPVVVYIDSQGANDEESKVCNSDDDRHFYGNHGDGSSCNDSDADIYRCAASNDDTSVAPFRVITVTTQSTVTVEVLAAFSSAPPHDDAAAHLEEAIWQDDEAKAPEHAEDAQGAVVLLMLMQTRAGTADSTYLQKGLRLVPACRNDEESVITGEVLGFEIIMSASQDESSCLEPFGNKESADDSTALDSESSSCGSLLVGSTHEDDLSKGGDSTHSPSRPIVAEAPEETPIVVSSSGSIGPVESSDEPAESKACARCTDATKTNRNAVVITESFMVSSVRRKRDCAPVGSERSSSGTQTFDQPAPFGVTETTTPLGMTPNMTVAVDLDSLDERNPRAAEIKADDSPASSNSDETDADAYEKLDQAIVLSFNHDHDLGLSSETAFKRNELMKSKDLPERTTARRVQTLLNGRYEIESDSEAKGVRNVVQRIERKLITRRRIVTGNRYYKVSRARPAGAIDGDNSSDTSSSTTSRMKPEPLNLACRLILRLASSDSASGHSSSSEDSSTTVSGSINLSVSGTGITRGDESRRSDDMHSFVLMLRQLKAIESRQQKLERRFQHFFVGRTIVGENGNEGSIRSKRDRFVERMREIGERQVTIPDKKEQERLKAECNRLERELERYGASFMLSDLHREEIATKEAKWEKDNMEANLQALKQIRRYMPVNVRTMSLKALACTLCPNGKTLPERVARKFKVTTILQLLRIDPRDIELMHPSVLEDLRMVDLTLVERRALHCHLRTLGPAWEKRKSGVLSERRWAWYEMLKNNFKEELSLHLDGDVADDLTAAGRKSVLLNSEADIEYSEDYGFPDGGEYELLTTSMRRGDLSDFSKTLDELKTTEEEPEADFLGPLIERMKVMDLETLRFHDEITTLEETIKRVGICHSLPHEAHHGREIASTDSSSSESIQVYR